MRNTPHDAGSRAKPVDRRSPTAIASDAASALAGRKAVGSIEGFGKMWQKTCHVRLGEAQVSPREVIAVWKAHFARFWPPDDTPYAPLTAIAPGEVVLLEAAVPEGLSLSTGVLVLYADDESFTFMTPQEHAFAGWITFSAYEAEGQTVAQVQVLMRARNPLAEAGLVLGGHRKESEFWKHTLRSLAHHFGVEAEPETEAVCVDRKRRWSKAVNVWRPAATRPGLRAPTPRRRARRCG